jgi:hypothetical protein
MDLGRAIDGYCERIGPGLWDEPVNAVTNLAFILAAAVMWRRSGDVPLARLLCVLLALIGAASGAFHTHAVVWTAAADSLSILVFVLVYLYAANRAFLGLGRAAALGGTTLFLPYAAATVPVFQLMPGLGGSAAYAPVPLLIALYALFLARRAPETAKGLAAGAAILVLSLIFRTLDAPLCEAVSVGTHFLWHILNAAMLGWMIEVYLRAQAKPRRALATGPSGR